MCENLKIISVQNLNKIAHILKSKQHDCACRAERVECKTIISVITMKMQF